jgi:hypothetical protein
MATALRLRRGTTSQHSTFTGLEGEVTVDTTKDTVVVHDGSTAGGFPLAKETGSTVAVAAGAVGTPGLTVSGDTNTGIFFPAADTIAFAEGGAEVARFDSNGRLGIGTTSPSYNLSVAGSGTVTSSVASSSANAVLRLTSSGGFDQIIEYTTVSTAGLAIKDATAGTNRMYINSSGNIGIGTSSPQGPLEVVGVSWFTRNSKSTSFNPDYGSAGTHALITTPTNMALAFATSGDNERMRIDSSGNVGIGVTSISTFGGSRRGLQISNSTSGGGVYLGANSTDTDNARVVSGSSGADLLLAGGGASGIIAAYTNGTERARITSGGVFCVGTTSTDPRVDNVAGVAIGVVAGIGIFSRTSGPAIDVNRKTDDGALVNFAQDGTIEGTISVSGNTVSYNAFTGGHWSQLQEGRGYNPDIPRGTVMSTIGEMCEWKSMIWDEVIEHPAVPAVEAKEAVLDEEGNVIEPAVEAVEGKDAWTETINKRDSYLGQLPIGATFEEDGVTKTVVDDGNERLPKVKISDVVGDKAVYGVFQTWDEVQDMLVTSLGAFVVRIASGVTVQIGDLLESNGDGCAKVQDDDVIRSKTIAKVTSTTPTATYADGSYTVPAVIYCG